MKKPRNKGFDNVPPDQGLPAGALDRNSLSAPEDIGSFATDSIALKGLELAPPEHEGTVAYGADESGDALSLYLRGVRRTELFTRPDIHRLHLIGQTHLLQSDGNLPAIRRGPIPELDRCGHAGRPVSQALRWVDQPAPAMPRAPNLTFAFRESSSARTDAGA